MARTVAIFIQQPAELRKPPGQALLPFPYKFTHEKKKKKKPTTKREAIPFCMYDSMNQPKNQKNPKNVHSCSSEQKQMAINAERLRPRRPAPCSGPTPAAPPGTRCRRSPATNTAAAARRRAAATRSPAASGGAAPW